MKDTLENKHMCYSGEPDEDKYKSNENEHPKINEHEFTFIH